MTLRALLLTFPILLVILAWKPLGVPANNQTSDKLDEASKTRTREPVKLTEEGLALHRASLVFDGHNDLPGYYSIRSKPSFFNPDITRKQMKLHTDIPRLREGGLGAQFWSAFVPCSTVDKGTSVRDTLEQIDVIHRMVKSHADTFEMASTANDVERIHKQGRIASLIGVEGGHSIDNSLGVLRLFYTLGVRYMTLTHSKNTDWADSATDKPKLNGLSKFGEEVVQEMNRLGMLVDISHISADTMRHVLRIARAPVIASHSSAFALLEHPRNVPDDVLRMLPKNGGVIMVNFYSGYVLPEAARVGKDNDEAEEKFRKEYSDPRQMKEAMAAWLKDHPMPTGSVHHVVDHIEHIIRVAGIDHVGLGSDYDGVSTMPKQLDDVSCYPYITQELLNRGYKKEDILKILGGNALRALRAAEAVAREK